MKRLAVALLLLACGAYDCCAYARQTRYPGFVRVLVQNDTGQTVRVRVVGSLPGVVCYRVLKPGQVDPQWFSTEA